MESLVASSKFIKAGPGLNKTTCLWIHFTEYCRSGNRAIRIMQVKEMLARCSGVATSDSQSNNDPLFAFPPVLFATQNGPDDPSALLAMAAQECQEVYMGEKYIWGGVETIAKNCSSHPIYEITVPVDGIDSAYGPSSPALLANTFIDHAFWSHQVMTLDTMAMYFRGGDILRENTNPYYFQGPCSLFTESWNAANVSRATLVYDPTAAIHPCVEVVRRAIGNASIVSTPCDSAGCHMMTIGQARYVVVSGTTTFANAGFQLFPGRRRIIFRYFCKREPHESPVGLEVCVDGESKVFKPWRYTNETRHAMLNLSSQVVLGNMTASSFRQYLQKGDDEHMALRGMRLRRL